jgi:hypothetical protein
MLRYWAAYHQHTIDLSLVASVKATERAVRNILRLRRAERRPDLAPEIAPVRADLEADLGPTLSRSRTARILGVSQTALDRWVAAGGVPTVLTPAGRREVPRQFVIELAERIDELRSGGDRRPLASALRERRERAERTTAGFGGASLPVADSIPDGHRTAERRSLAFHRLVAERLTPSVVSDARRRIEELEQRGQIDPVRAGRWHEVLSRRPEEIAALITRDTPEWRDLRQSSPFAGVATEQERRLINERVG